MKGKTVLVTGGTGSFGQVFVKEALRLKAAKVIVFSRDEHKQVQMERGISESDNKRVRFFLGDIRGRLAIRRACHGVNIIIHAAALKHVPKCEYSPFEAIQTNVIGAQNIVDAAIDNEVERVLAISTDKAVNPINLYGAAKLCADKLFLAAHNYVGSGYPTFAVIRFGNFLESRGSVVPFFKELKKAGKTHLPLTHPDMTRFFIPLHEAVSRAIEAVAMARGGEIFVPKMASMRIEDIAKAFGMPTKDIGRREGEKLHEELILNSDAFKTYVHQRFYITHTYGKGKGMKVGPAFEYRSDTNSQWMDAVELEGL